MKETTGSFAGIWQTCSRQSLRVKVASACHFVKVVLITSVDQLMLLPLPLVWPGVIMRNIASYIKTPVTTQIINTDIKAPRTSAR